MAYKKGLQTSDVKINNRIAILKILRKNVSSRVEIAKNLGMSRPAVSSTVNELIEEGLAKEVGKSESTQSGGKRATLLSINSRAAYSISVFINNQDFEIAVMDLSSNIILHKKFKLKYYVDYRITFEEIIVEIRKMIKELIDLGIDNPIIACSVIIKGMVNTETGKLVHSATLPDWSNIPIVDYFQEKLNIPVFIENDARAYTLFELKDKNEINGPLVCINIGSGIGTGVVIDNKIYRGNIGAAGILGHTTVLDGGPLCNCGNRGCWEALISVPAFLKELERTNPAYSDVTLETVIEKYKADDGFIKEIVFNYIGYWLAVGISNIISIFNPREIVIQGKYVEFGNELLQKIKNEVKNRKLSLIDETNISFSTRSSSIN